MPQICSVYGHRLGRPKYFSSAGNQYYLRHCQRCEYFASGEITMTKDGLKVFKGGAGTRKNNVVDANPQSNIVESEHLSDPNA